MSVSLAKSPATVAYVGRHRREPIDYKHPKRKVDYVKRSPSVGASMRALDAAMSPVDVSSYYIRAL